MKRKYAIIAVNLFLAITVCAAFLYGSGRNRSLEEVCPLSSREVLTGATLYRSSPTNDELEQINLTKEQFHSLLDQMDKIKYKKIGRTSAMGQDENYATLNYTVDQRKIEIMFSNTNGGRILVNIVSKKGNAPLYQMVPSGESVQKMILNFFNVPLNSDV